MREILDHARNSADAGDFKTAYEIWMPLAEEGVQKHKTASAVSIPMVIILIKILIKPCTGTSYQLNRVSPRLNTTSGLCTS